MLGDTSKSDDPDQIRLNVPENSWSDKKKQHFKERLDALLSHPDFLLLYIPEGGEKMKIVKPANDSYHRHRIVQRTNEYSQTPNTWYALSHVWGLSNTDQHLWYDIGQYVDDESGRPVAAVSMRHEKRNTLLKLLEDRPGSYWWIDVLCARHDTPLEIMGDIYSCCFECIAMIDCEPDVIPQLRSLEESFYVRDPSSSTQCYDLYLELKYLLDRLLGCSWWERVWTWQEMVLPYTVLLVAETTTQISSDNMLNAEALQQVFDSMRCQLSSDCVKMGTALSQLQYFSNLEELIVSRSCHEKFISGDNPTEWLVFLLCRLRKSSRRCMVPIDYVYGVLGVFQFSIPRMADTNAIWENFLSEIDNLLTSDDYMVQSTPIRVTSHARQLDLKAANNLGDMYYNLLNCDLHLEMEGTVSRNEMSYTITWTPRLVYHTNEHIM
ncbi:hypothetical protein K492DRAFT_204891 [Lichtheimia hyalospora FSU 10163]|nr:hypothetical protein K492DRAFT_204891 [Lichtheimia hyalospora FSU 10163]